MGAQHHTDDAPGGHGRLQARKLITHQFRLDEMMKAYDTFGNAAKEKALKVLLTAGW